MSSIEKKLIHKIQNFLQENRIPQNCDLLIALSGGPDSTALLYLLNAIKNTFSFSLQAAYVNHGLRDTSQLDLDDAFVSNLTDKLGVKLYVKKAQPGELYETARREGRSLEEVARQFRYDFFSRIMVDQNNPFLLLGHNFDDQMETMIIRFFQGSGFEGLKGIPHSNNRILRPLIHVRKSEIVNYLKSMHLEYRIDPSNEENDFLRNRIRNNVIPQLEEIFPGLEKGLLRQESRFIALNNTIDEKADLIEVINTENKSSVSLHSFNNADNLIRKKILYKMFDQVYRGPERDFRLPSAFFNTLLNGEVHTGRIYAQAHGVSIGTDKYSLYTKVKENRDEGFYAILDEEITIIPGKYRVTMGKVSETALSVVEKSPLIFRSSTSSDYIITEKRRFSLKDLAATLGCEIPLIEDSLGVVAVLGALAGGENLYRKKKINASEKFNILYLEVGKEK